MTHSVIQYDGDALPGIVNDTEAVLIGSGMPIYQRDGKLVRIGRFPTKDGKPDLRFVEVSRENLVELLTAIIAWKIPDHGKHVPGACPDRVASTLLARAGQWKLPVLHGIITAPTLRSDGSMIDQPGYDRSTGLFFDPQDVEFPAIPDDPSWQDARGCLDVLIATVSEVPFVDLEGHGATNRSVFLSALLASLIRTILPAIPLHGFSAPSAGSGKSILVDGISFLLTGAAATPLTQGSEEETTKVLSSALQAGSPIISFDNCEYPLGGAMLCQAITQPRLAVRTLGKSELRNITNTAMYFATGNNLLFTGDLAKRRAMRCTVDSGCERPEERKFTTQRPDLKMRDNRVEMVTAGLIVLRAFFAAGCPQSGLEPVGNFERWSEIVRAALVWLGEPDPWVSTSIVREDDPKAELDLVAMTAWWETFQDTRMQTKDIIEHAKKYTEGGNGHAPRPANPALRDAMIGITGNDLTSQNVGNWLRGIRDRPIGGFVILQATKLDGNGRWQLINNNPVESVGSTFFT